MDNSRFQAAWGTAEWMKAGRPTVATPVMSPVPVEDEEDVVFLGMPEFLANTMAAPLDSSSSSRPDLSYLDMMLFDDLLFITDLIV